MYMYTKTIHFVHNWHDILKMTFDVMTLKIQYCWWGHSHIIHPFQINNLYSELWSYVCKRAKQNMKKNNKLVLSGTFISQRTCGHCTTNVNWLTVVFLLFLVPLTWKSCVQPNASFFYLSHPHHLVPLVAW